MHRRASLFVRQSVDGYLVRHHKRRIEPQAKMPDNLVFIGLVFVFFQKILGAGKSDLVNILFHFLRSHADSVIGHLNGLVVGIYRNLNLILQAFRTGVLAHQLQLLQLGDGVASIGYQFPVKNIVVGIQPLFDNREYILAVNG